jgi:hypothetical protein
MLRQWVNRWMRSQRRSFRGGQAIARLARRLTLEALEARTVPSFAAPTAFDLGAAPAAVAVGHFKGAAAPLDVVTANANGTVSVLLGKSDGSIQNPILLNVGGTPNAVAVGDFTGNGLDDIAVANANGTVSVLLSNGNGTFQASETFAIGATPVGVAVGDFNGDGKPDLVTVNNNGTVTVLPGKGGGAFAAGVTSTVGGNLTSVAVGDFNGDHKPDLVVGTSTGLDILLGNGNGTFQLGQTVTFSRTVHGFTFTFAVNSVAVSSLRGNGKADIVALSQEGLAVLLGNGDGTVQQPALVDGGPSVTASFVVGDFNGDGKPDIVTSDVAQESVPSSVNFLAGNGDGTFAAPTTVNLGETASSLAAGNFGTGKLNLVMAGPNTVSVLSGNGDGTFATAPTVATNNAPTLIAAADFNGDGKPDLVTAGVGDVVVLLNNGNGSFRLGPSLAIDGVAAGVAVGDFAGNGKQDIAVATENGTIDVFLGNGNGTFQGPKVINLGDVVIRSLVAGNFGRGLPDLAATVMLQDGSETTVVQVLDNTGNGTFAPGQSVAVGTFALGLAAADFNGDGKPDLVTTSFLPDGTRNVEVLLGNGDGTFQNPVSTAPGFGVRYVAAGDFNGDGKADLVVADGLNTVMVLPGNGNGTFGKPLVLKFPSLGGAAPVVVDFFGDGKQGIALATGQGQVTVLRGNGDGTFQAPVNFLTDFVGNQPSALVAADFNGDGKPDLATTNYFGNDVSVLLNTSPKPAAGAIATTMTLTADHTTVVSGQPVLLTATVTAASGTATGTVTFFDGSQVLGEAALDPNGQARLLVPLHAGAHSLHASFAGTEPFTGSASATVNETVKRDATTTTLTVQHVWGSLFELNAAVIPVAPGGGAPTGTLTFRDGNKVIGTISLSQGGTLDLRLLKGKHTLTVSYSGDSDFLGSLSDTIELTV